ncbi:MAG: efflux RND transporter permease subunit [Deltaproteobacteria bacterium]|nr:efflux RND transporter permease subunit [Deltaproteobacteria bacterium]MBW2360765.1 efflux RND transporter permease subunit [Deltaproteobacteria bacterium]
MTLPEFSVRQTVLVNVLFVVCMVGGWNALKLTEVEYYHDVTLNEAVITTRWNGASADEVERLLTAKLEEELLSVGNIDEIRSASQSNISVINVDFDETLDTIDYESAINDVRGALEQAQDLPLEADEPILREIITTEFRKVIFVVFSDVGGVGALAVRDVAREALSRLRELPGVSRVEVRAEQEREVRVLVDRDRAALYGLTVDDIAERLRRQNQNLSAGTFQDEAGEATLRATGDYTSIVDILDTIVRDEGPGTRVRLRDVARVERGLEKPIFITRYQGRPAVVISIAKKDETDVRELSDSVSAFVEKFAPLLPAGITIGTTLDSADFVTPRIAVLLNNLATGMLLVLALLWFTIGFRNSLLTIIAIPFSFLTAILFFPLLDISINATTLIGMLLVSGMLVDDAIIVLENIYRRIEAGDELRQAVVNGANEVLWPVTAAVTTTVAAFLPLLLVEGTAGKFVAVLPKCVVVCLLASLFECLVILPAHYLDFGSRSAAKRAADDARGWRRGVAFFQGLRYRMDRGFDRLRAGYRIALAPVITHRFAFGVLTLSSMLAAFAGAQRLPVELFPGEYLSFNISLESPPDYSLQQTSALASQIEARLAAMPSSDIRDFNTVVGLSVDLNFDRILAPNLALIAVAVTQTEANQLRPQDVLQRVRDDMKAFAAENPEGVVALRVEPEPYGPPVGRPVEVRIQSEDFAINRSIADELMVYLATIPGVSAIDDNLKEGPREIRLKIDEERAGQYGLTFEDLARALRGANDGAVTSSFRSPSAVEDDDIRVLLEPGQRDRILDLLEVGVRGTNGQLVRLADVADLDITRGYLAYRRVDGKRAVTVFADVDDDLATSLSVNRDLQARFADIRQRFPQVNLIYGGEYQESNEAIANTVAAFPVALLLIYMILAALFRSYSQPFIVLTSVPLGFAGIVFGVGVFGYNVSFNLLYASVGLTGVVVNDALVLVDFINRGRRDGVPMLEAVAQAGAQRLRPVVLTTMTTVVALLPMALGIQGSSKSYGPFAASIAFGLLFAMIGTLFVIPLSYSVLAVAEERAGRLRARLRQRRRHEPTASVSPGRQLGR